MTDGADESFQLLGSPKKKKKRKKKSKSEKLNGDTNEQTVNPFFHPSFSSDHSSAFSWHVDSQDTEDSQTQQEKSERKTRGSQLENSWVVTESTLESEVGTGTIKKKRKRKHSSSEQDGDHMFYVPETPEETNSLPEADQLEDAGDSYEIMPKKKKKKKKKKAAKAPSEEEANEEASVGRTDLASDLEDTQTDLFLSSFQSKTQDADFFQSEVEKSLPVPDPSPGSSSPTTRKKSRKHKKHPSISSTTGNADATKDGFSVKDTVQAERKHGKSKRPRELQKSHLSVETDKTGSSPKQPTSEPVLFDNEFLNSLDYPMPDLETVTRELEEFIPHVRQLSDPLIMQLARRDLVRFKNFKKQGISVRFGKFSKKENELLRKNVDNFLEESGIDSAEKLLFTHRFPEEQANLKKLKNEHLFGLKIAQGIPRPWRLVYYRARKMFDPQNYNGKYSKREKKLLKKYHTLYGNNWKKMSELIGRSSHSLQLKYYEMISEFNSGPWSREELRKLVEAVKAILRPKVEGLDPTMEPKNMDEALLLRQHLYKQIPWFRVAATVGTRTWKQCKTKWLSIVTKRMSRGKTRNRGLENMRFKIDLIKRLYELNVEDIDEVDWEDLSSIIGNVPPDYVRNRFHRIKTMYVPVWKRTSFSETVDYLYKETRPKLQHKVAGREVKRVSMKDRIWKKFFPFNDIFPDGYDSDNDLIEDEEDDEDDEENGRWQEAPVNAGIQRNSVSS